MTTTAPAPAQAPPSPPVPARTFIDPDRHVRAADLRGRDVIKVDVWREVLDVFTSVTALGQTFDVGAITEGAEGTQAESILWSAVGDGRLFAHASPSGRDETVTEWKHIGYRLSTGEYTAVRVLLHEDCTGGDIGWAWVLYPNHHPVRIAHPYTTEA